MERTIRDLEEKCPTESGNLNEDELSSVASLNNQGHEKKHGYISRKDELITLMEELERTKQELRDFKTKAHNNKEEDDNEKELLKNELEILKEELEDHKEKLREKLKIHEDNYSTHLEIINELYLKVEALTEECEFLRKSTDKESEPLRSPIRERDILSLDNIEDLCLKFEGLEKNLHFYLEERKELLNENGSLRAKLEEIKSKECHLEGTEVEKHSTGQTPRQQQSQNVSEQNKNDEKIEQYKIEAEKLEKQINQRDAINLNLEQTINDLKKNLHDSQQENRKILEQFEILEGHKSQVEDLKIKIQEKETINCKLEENIEEINKNLSETVKEKDQLVEQLKIYHIENQELKDQISNLKTEIESIKQESISEKAHEGDNINQIEALQQKLKNAENQCEELNEIKKSLEERLNIITDRNEDLERQLEHTQMECNLRIEGYEKLMEEFKGGLINKHSAEDEILEKCQQLQEICDEFELKCEQLTQQKEALERDLELCMEENERLKRDYEEN